MRILITGARGQLGQSLRHALPEDWELIATDSTTMDITQKDLVSSMMEGFQPDVLINTAAYTNVDAAQNDAQKAFLYNADCARHLARAARQQGARFIHFSSDYIFDGQKTTPYAEDDAPCPINVYGQSKLAGEALVLAEHVNTLIIRTSGLFSAYGKNFVKTIAARLIAGETVSVPNNQITCPTYAPHLAHAVFTLLREQPDMRGIWHCCGDEAMSWYQLAQEVARTIGSDESLVQADNDPQPTARPAYSALCSHRFNLPQLVDRKRAIMQSLQDLL